MVDLHVHSNISDGTLSPRDVVKHAVELGVKVMALTDHDTVMGVEEALEAARIINEASQDKVESWPVITVIPGIEISAGYKDGDVHILGYFVNYQHDAFTKMMDAAVQEREERNEQMAAKFREAGIPLTIASIKEMSHSEVVTRAHFAQWLMAHGYCKNRKEAFDKYIDFGKPFFVPRKYTSREAAVAIIRAAGGIPVLAHPLLYHLKPQELEELIQELVGYGIKGIETYYSSNVNNDEDTVRHLAIKYGLVMTGGSDFHGENKPGLEIGKGLGNLKVPYSAYEELLKVYKQ